MQTVCVFVCLCVSVCVYVCVCPRHPAPAPGHQNIKESYVPPQPMEVGGSNSPSLAHPAVLSLQLIHRAQLYQDSWIHGGVTPQCAMSAPSATVGSGAVRHGCLHVKPSCTSAWVSAKVRSLPHLSHPHSPATPAAFPPLPTRAPLGCTPCRPWPPWGAIKEGQMCAARVKAGC